MIFFDNAAGLGGFAYGAWLAGLKFIKHFFSEINKFCIQVYKQRFPDAIYLGDMKQIDCTVLPNGKYVFTSGFSCQPFSNRGKKLGVMDDRNTWPATFELFKHIKPIFAIFENVDGCLDYIDGVVCPEIESVSYSTETFCFPASALGADHQRKRWWVVAYPNSYRFSWIQMRTEINCTWRKEFTLESLSVCNGTGGLSTFPRIQRTVDGISSRMDRLKALGNSIVPQIAAILFMRVMELIG